MSYDIYLTDPVTHETLETKEKHFIVGGTYAVGGTREMWINVTYNYYPFFKRVFGDEGIRLIYGMTGAESIFVHKQAISNLGDDACGDYWKPTEGNAKRALSGLLALAQMRPDGIWDGD